jgi:hypothetical protein
MLYHDARHVLKSPLLCGLSLQATVRSVRAAGGYPVCYITIGSWEPNARDAAEFLPGDLGRNFTAYAGQRYLNVRSANVRRLMVKVRGVWQEQKFGGAMQVHAYLSSAGEHMLPQPQEDVQLTSCWFA